jgi:hypothetical protein
MAKNTLPPGRYIAARYIGQHSVLVPPRERTRRYVHADGTDLPAAQTVIGFDKNKNAVLGAAYLLEPGATMLMPEHEILGQTLLIDPTLQQPPIWRGWGWCPEDRHRAYLPHQLQDMRFLGPDGIIRTYDFHAPRADFEPLDPSSEPTYVRFPTRDQLLASQEEDADARNRAEAEEAAYRAALAVEPAPESVADTTATATPAVTPKPRVTKAAQEGE